ncbi:hypothetical protein RD792_013786 [Penstemon davidsonii]|uniref:Phosphoinositide phospholipase C n=1 Tax=Penstemon davidsonii TaxID=160366 RepID=A0ABR0CVB8_9LAMI|nr:hypothetical protein RD792_013786 [Penstemon davidsonii]
MSKQTYRVCFCFRRRFRLAAAEAPSDIKSIFNEYAENGVMGLDQLRKFLVEVQGEENATVEDAQAIMDGLNEFKHLNIFHRRGLNLEAFFKYLFGDVNPPLNPKCGVHHDMNAPLSHYFIYTGHNSYLTGNQLSSDCSDVPIINALHRGVRVIELDIWPNSTKDNVDVLHGRTLTTPVELIKCLKSIKEHAFVASEYPVVITLEDHLTPDLQAKVAEMITQTFGDMLFSPGPECLGEFPSPESLKKRVMISTKPPKEYLKAKDDKVKESGSKKDKNSAVEEPWGREVKSFKKNYDKDDDLDEEGDEDDDDDDDDDDEDEDSKLQHAAPEYKHLIAIHAGKGKGGMQDWLKVYPDKVRRLSLSEQELLKAITDYGKDIVRANGGCGYVKKPDFLLKTGSHGEVFDSKATLPVKTTLRVTIYMGEGWYYDFHHAHFDAYSPPDFYARVGIAGVPADSMMKKTKALEDTWIPNWDEVFEFPLTVPELALLRVEVHEYDMSEKDDFAGQTCLPVSELRKGIRSVPLHSRKGENALFFHGELVYLVAYPGYALPFDQLIAAGATTSGKYPRAPLMYANEDGLLQDEDGDAVMIDH